jgi:hypothetical protein
MIEVLARMLLEQDYEGRIQVAFEAHHAGVHATKKELAAVNSLIEAMKATSILASDLHRPRPRQAQILTLTNGERGISVRELPQPKKKKKSKRHAYATR